MRPLAKGVLHNELVGYGVTMSAHKPLLIVLQSMLGVALVWSGGEAAAQNMATYQGRDAFVAAWWPASVTIHTGDPIGSGLDQAAASSSTLRGFIVGSEAGPAVVLATARVKGAQRLRVVFSDGQQCPLTLPSSVSERESPLIKVPLLCDVMSKASWAPLTWDKQPELGPGRRVWLLEQPASLQAGGPPQKPILVRGALRGQAPAPFSRYWAVDLQQAIGAPLLDDQGRIICVVFRYPSGPGGSALCAPHRYAFKGLSDE